MAFGYVDDHRFLLYQEGRAARDITPWVGEPALRDVLDVMSLELTFQAVRNDLLDPFLPWPDIRPGDKVRVVNHALEVFSGVVLTVGLDGSVTANDLGWYPAKSQIILQVSGAAAQDAIRRMCAKAGIPVGTLPALPTRITRLWAGETPADILQDILAECSAETGRQYKVRVAGGALTVTQLPESPMTAYHKPADNLAPFDVTLAKGKVSGTDSMAEMYNSVLLLREEGDTAQVLARAHNQDSVRRYGLQQLAQRLDGKENAAQARQRTKNLLERYDRLTARAAGMSWEAGECALCALVGKTLVVIDKLM